MAVKEKKDEDVSRIMQVLSTETKFEQYLFVFVSLASLLLGVLFLTNVLAIREDVPIIGSIATPFAIVLVVIGGLGVLYGLWPFFKPALPEFKKITWPTWAQFLADSIRTFIFIILLALLFLLFDMVISEVFKRIMQ